jgi:putative oxidoreductase
MDPKLAKYWPFPLRLLLGIAFLYHGLPKLGGAGHASIVGLLHQIGMPAAGFLAWVVALVETLGGVALIIGAFVPIATALLIIDMLVAMFTHLPYGFNFINITGATPQGPQFGMPGAEVNLLYIAALLALFIGGPGPLSVDETVFHGFRSFVDRLRHGPPGALPHRP